MKRVLIDDCGLMIGQSAKSAPSIEQLTCLCFLQSVDWGTKVAVSATLSSISNQQSAVSNSRPPEVAR